MSSRLSFDALIAALRCPSCRAALGYRAIPDAEHSEGRYGVLRCGCSAFPVLDGIPVLLRSPVGMFEHTRGKVEVEGVPASRLVELVECGRGRDALAEALLFPRPLGAWSRVLPWRLVHGGIGRRLARWRGRRRVLTGLLEARHRLGAIQVFDFFYGEGGPLDPAVGEYFKLRFGQPRHVAALALLARLPTDSQPILDFACGAGHLDHYLAKGPAVHSVVGVDMNFFHVWIARHWMAPDAQFVCANASDGLPFVDGAFSAVVCSDAFHYLRDRQAFVAEFHRCAPGRPMILTRVGNVAVMPNEGFECDLAGYRAEFGSLPSVAFHEDSLVRAYLKGSNPLREPPQDDAVLENEKWLSFVVNPSAPMLEAPGVGELPPHASGRLGLNPVYRPISSARGRVELRFEFPLVWYAYENHAMLRYHPRRVEISASIVDPSRTLPVDEETRALVDQFVLLGLPDRFTGAA